LFLNTGYQFIGNSGRHLTGYCNIDPLLPHVKFLEQMVEDMIKPFLSTKFVAILDAAVGAIPLGTLAAKYVIDKTGRDIKAVFADKKSPKGQEIKRDGFKSSIAGKKILLLDGVINSGFTASQLLRIARENNCEVIGMTSVAAKDDVSAKTLGVPKLHSLVQFDYEVFEPNNCLKSGPCAQKLKIVADLGHGADYRGKHPDYSGGFISLVGV